MTNEDFTTLILDKLGWDYERELNPNRYRNTEILYAGDLILALLVGGTTEKAAQHLNTNYKRLYNSCVNTLVPVFGNLQGGGQTWKQVLLKYIEYKKCSTCQKVLSHAEFNMDSHSPDGRYACCKSCRVFKNSDSYKRPNIKEAHKRSQELHYFDILERNAKYRAERAKRVPIWYNTQHDEIKAFYKACPDGYQVDHVIPLRGDNVSGLHVITNLQYLTPEDNLKKSNRYTIE